MNEKKDGLKKFNKVVNVASIIFGLLKIVATLLALAAFAYVGYVLIGSLSEGVVKSIIDSIKKH